MTKYYLSPSKLNIFRDCPRCFWLHINQGIKRPRGIFPSLPGGMDLVIKTYFDKYRLKKELPPEIKRSVEGELFSDLSVLKKWRSWKKTDLYYENEALNVTLSGALDDCLIQDNFYIPLDYKTRGSKLIEDPRKYYQTQLDCYCLILESSGYKTKNLSYLLYYWPEEVKENGLVQFSIKPIKIENSIESAKNIVEKAVSVLLSKIPKASDKCEFCNLVTQRKIDDDYEK